MRKLLKRGFNLFVKMRWLKIIDKENQKYERLKRKTNQQLYVLSALLKEYHEICDDKKQKSGKGCE